MTVLTILGVLAVLAVIFFIATAINSYSSKKFRYEFFEGTTFTIITIAYGLLLFGDAVYEGAVKNGGDILNGQLMIAIGILLIMLDIWINIKNTNLIEGLFFSVIQLLFYVAGIAVLAFIAIIAIGAYNNGHGYYCDDDCY